MRSSFYILSCLASILSCALPALASDAQHWEVVTATAGLGDGWRISAENIARTSQSRGFYELEQNLMLGHTLDAAGLKGVTVWLGYTHDPNYTQGSFTLMEHRFRQQVTADRLLTIGKATVSGRIRLEERWREGQMGMAWRLRPYARLSVPVTPRLALVATHESFLDLNRTGFQRIGGEERTRTFVGVNRRLWRRVSVDVGYMNQHGFVPDGADTTDNIAYLELKAPFQ